MIPNQWYAILESKEVKSAKPVAFKRLGMELVFWRDDTGKVVAMEDRCPHRQVKLSLGKLVDNCIECPFHGFRFDSKGECQLIPANGRNGVRPKIFQVQVQATQEKHGYIWLWYGEAQEEYPPIPFYNEDMSGYTIAGFQTKWAVHYTRAIENQLDVAHLPFVHANSIGKGNQTLVNGPYTLLENDAIYVWMNNQKDHGQIAQKLGELAKSDGAWTICFKFPNLWMLRLADNYRLGVAFVPIDAENTLLYTRTYLKAGKFKLLNRLVTEVSSLLNYPILGQDKRIVISQPKPGGVESGDKYIPADRPIVTYHNHRKKLIEMAEQAEPASIKSLDRHRAG
jgi:phenylpropionate dioxygenase-like ring-hydroxylating dioxygenase large terminal subunit